MYTIRNATVVMYSYSNKVCWIAAKREEQDSETLNSIGRGKMLTVSYDQLRYDLPDDITLFLNWG